MKKKIFIFADSNTILISVDVCHSISISQKQKATTYVFFWKISYFAIVLWKI